MRRDPLDLWHVTLQDGVQVSVWAGSFSEEGDRLRFQRVGRRRPRGAGVSEHRDYQSNTLESGSGRHDSRALPLLSSGVDRQRPVLTSN